MPVASGANCDSRRLMRGGSTTTGPLGSRSSSSKSRHRMQVWARSRRGVLEMRKGTQRFDAASSRSAKHETVFANHKSYIVDVKDTLPASGYVFRVRVYYGEVEGPWSKPSEEASTPARGAPSKIVGSSAQALGRGLTLTVPRPFDDGGSTIKGLVLRFRHHDSENFPGAWRHVGSFATKDWPLQLDVTNELLTSREDSSHNHSYEFSVAPYNRLGVAPWSGPTAPCATNNEEKATSFGHGAFDRHTRHHIPRTMTSSCRSPRRKGRSSTKRRRTTCGNTWTTYLTSTRIRFMVL